jgi:hypothetical protein
MDRPDTSDRSEAVTGTNHRWEGEEVYEIRVKGHLDGRWAAWFDGLHLTRDDGGTTFIRGRVADQAALHGLLSKMRDLGLPLLSVVRVDPSLSHPDQATRATNKRRLA